MTVFMTLIIYAVLIGVHLDPNVRAKSIEAFGRRPFGYPVTVVVIAATTILYLPAPWFTHHFMLLAYHSARDGEATGRFGLFLDIFAIHDRHPHLHRSQSIAIAGMLYVAAIAAAWIVYAASRGI